MISVIGGKINTDDLKQILKATYNKDKKGTLTVPFYFYILMKIKLLRLQNPNHLIYYLDLLIF